MNYRYYICDVFTETRFGGNPLAVLPEAHIDRPGRPSQGTGPARWLTLLPVLARPEARSIFVVGFGGGVLLESVPSSVERVDVVELEPEVIAANRAITVFRPEAKAQPKYSTE